MKVWAIANQKGGVGKTTTTVSLAGHLAARGHETLLIDLDPHGSLTSYFGFDPDSVENGAYTLYQRHASRVPADPTSLIHPTRFPKLQIMPANMALATLDRQSGKLGGMGLVVAEAVKSLEGRFEYVLLDCPPMLGVLMVNALAACERLIIPVQTEFLAIKGLERMLSTLNMINNSRPLPLDYTIVPTLFDRRTRASIETARHLQERFASHLWDEVIPVDTRFREASRAGAPLPIMQPNARGSIAYHHLLNYLQAFDSIEQVAAR